MSFQEILAAGSRPAGDENGNQGNIPKTPRINGRASQIASYNEALAAAPRHISAAQVYPAVLPVDAVAARMAHADAGATMNASETSASLGLRSGARTWQQIGNPESGKN